MRRAIPVLLLLAACSSSDSDTEREARREEWRALSRTYWDIRSLAPLEPGRTPPRVAVVDFSVRYTLDAQLPTDRKRAVPARLYRDFVKLAPDFDREAVPIETVARAAAYGLLPGKTLAELPAAALVSPEIWFPAEGLKALEGSAAALRNPVLDVLREVDADVGLAVRLWIAPVQGGSVAIEIGSSVTAYSKGGASVLLLKTPFISNQQVVEGRGPDGRPVVNEPNLQAAVETLFRRFIGSAMLAAERR